MYINTKLFQPCFENDNEQTLFKQCLNKDYLQMIKTFLRQIISIQ
jgi:hypothetical protein